MRCALFSRALQTAAVFIGALPVGPTCARKADLLVKARKGAGALRLATGRLPRLKRADPQTLDLFEEGAIDA